MMELGADIDLENLIQKYRRVNASIPFIIMQYNNSMAFQTRKRSKTTLKAGVTVRGTFRFITGGRVLSVSQARFSRNVDQIAATVGGRVVPGARDPKFMARLEHGGTIPQDKFGRVNIPTVRGARGGSITKGVGKFLSLPRLAALATSARNVSGSDKKKRAVAMGAALRDKKKIVRMTDRRGRDSIYRVTGKGRGRNRSISEVKKLWTMSPKQHSTPAVHWLQRARNKAIAGRVKTFTRIAEIHIARRALKGK